MDSTSEAEMVGAIVGWLEEGSSLQDEQLLITLNRLQVAFEKIGRSSTQLDDRR